MRAALLEGTNLASAAAAVAAAAAAAAGGVANKIQNAQTYFSNLKRTEQNPIVKCHLLALPFFKSAYTEGCC